MAQEALAENLESCGRLQVSMCGAESTRLQAREAKGNNVGHNDMLKLASLPAKAPKT